LFVFLFCFIDNPSSQGISYISFILNKETNMKKMIFLLVAGGCLLGLPAKGISRAVDETIPRTVQVDVIVTKDGRPVKDLSKADFALIEDEKQVPVEAVSLVETRAGEAGGGSRRLVAVYHETSFWDLNLKPQVAEVAEELVKLSRQGIEIMVVKMNWTEDLQVLQPFTSEESLIRAAAEEAIWTIGGDKIYDADGDKRSLLAYRNISLQRFEKTLGGLLTVCTMVRDAPGRKSVLLISGGIPDLSSSSISDVLDGGKEGRDALDAIHVRDQEGYTNVRIFDPFGIMKNRTFDRAEDVILELVRFANTNGISIYALDPGVFSRASKTGTAEYLRATEATGREFVEEEKSKQLQNLRLIAEGTNAALFRGSEKFARMDAVLNGDIGSYYRLDFVPGRKKADGAYHELDVRLGRKGLDVRARKGYRDETAEDLARDRLVSAYYAPDLYKELPFAGEFVPFSSGKGKSQPWMSLALPTREIFPAGMTAGPATLDLHFWVKKAGEKAYGGMLTLPFTVDEAFLENVRKRSFLWYNFCGPDLDFSPGEYQAVYALVGRESGKIGTCRSLFAVPDPGEEPAFLNCVLGAVAENPEKQKDVFALNRENGRLEYGGLIFFPQVTNRFPGRQEDVFVFCQIYDPSGTGKMTPEFRVADSPDAPKTLDSEVVAESWNKKSKVWSGICRIDFRFVSSAEHVFQAVVAGPGGKPSLGPEIKLVKLNN